MPTRAPTDDWGVHLASRVVDEVAALAGGRLRPQSAALLTDMTVHGYDLFLAVADLTPNRRAAVLETLEAYLDSGSSVGAVADALHLHRQSVNYRMQNVRRLFGPRLMSANGRLALHIAVKAARLQRR